jgi:ribose transport system substrate-binding protein
MSRTTVAASLIAVTQIFALAAHAESPEAARAREQLEPYRQLPKFQAPGEAFDARACMKGKSTLSIPASSAVPFIKTIQESIEKLAGEVGFTYKPWENQGQVTQWVQGFDYAINNKFQLIELLAGADPRFVEPQVKAAKAAGLMVVAPISPATSSRSPAARPAWCRSTISAPAGSLPTGRSGKPTARRMPASWA